MFRLCFCHNKLNQVASAVLVFGGSELQMSVSQTLLSNPGAASTQDLKFLKPCMCADIRKPSQGLTVGMQEGKDVDY